MNYIQRVVQYGDETGGFKQFHDITRGRHESKQIHNKIKEKMLHRRISLGEVFNCFFFQLTWRAFGKGIVASGLIPRVDDLSAERIWKAALPKLLPLFGKAKDLALRALAILFGQFTDAEKAYMKKFKDINEFLHERGHLIDMIWEAFVNELFNGNHKMERTMFNIFISAIIDRHREVQNNAIGWIGNKQREKPDSPRGFPWGNPPPFKFSMA